MTIATRDVKWLGYKRDMRDARDHVFTPPRSLKVPAKSTSLRQFAAPIMDQGELGSCVAHATIGAMRTIGNRRKHPIEALSRLQLYYDARVIEGTVDEDSGLEIRDAVKVVAKQGVGPERLWEYRAGWFKTKPPEDVYDERVDFEASKYERVAVTNSLIKAALALGYPVIIGITVFESFDAVNGSGVVPVPDLHREQPLGGHSMYVLGYEKGNYIVANSWGVEWGDQGFCYIPEKIVGSTQYGGDYWIIRAVENKGR